jgi:hypothetical protein
MSVVFEIEYSVKSQSDSDVTVFMSAWSAITALNGQFVYPIGGKSSLSAAFEIRSVSRERSLSIMHAFVLRFDTVSCLGFVEARDIALWLLDEAGLPLDCVDIAVRRAESLTKSDATRFREKMGRNMGKKC